jgi:putative transposase
MSFIPISQVLLKKSHLYRINDVENHLHIIIDMNLSIAPIDFMRDVKVSTSL